MFKSDRMNQPTRPALPMSRSVATARSISEIVSILIILGGCAVLIGWALNIQTLKSIYPGFVTMKVNTAICFVLTGITLWCFQIKRIDNAWFHRIGLLCGFLILLIGLGSLCEFIYHYNLGIDQLFIKEPAGTIFTPFPGRMAFNGAVSFFLIGVVFLFFSIQKIKFIYVIQFLALLVGITPFISLISYSYGAVPFYLGGQFTSPISLPAAIIFILTSIGILFLRPDQGLMAHVHCDLIGGKMFRRLLPVAFAVPIIMGFCKILAQRAHLFSNEFGVCLVAIGNLSIITIYLYFLSVLLNRSDIRRKVLEDSTAHSKDYLEKIINTVADPMFVKDKGHRWVLVNSAFCEFFGRKAEDITGSSDYHIFPKDQADISWEKDEELLLEGKDLIDQESFVDAKGDLKIISTKRALYVDSHGNKFIVGVIRDVTKQVQIQEKIEKQSQELEFSLREALKSRRIMVSMLDDNNKIREDLEHRLEELKRSQNMLIHSEKLASLGRLVSEITHEINNPLMIISGYAQLSMISNPISDEQKNNLKIIVQECQRAKDVTKRILRFSRSSKGESKEVEINQCLETVVSIVERQFVLNNNIEIKRVYSEKPIYVLLDEQQMHEVFMNLLNNAKESMPNNGVITVTTSTEGMYLRIDFKDTGAGMSPEVMRKITEPFFTTKETGTGIGLGVCYAIIKAHNGELTYTSEVGKGTVVTVWLPLKGGHNG